MPARIRLVNWKWVRWSGGKWGKGEPQLMQGTVEAILDRVGGKWRIPDAPELEEEIAFPTDVCDPERHITGKPYEIAFNEFLKQNLPYTPPHLPNRRIELVELFEEPEWEPKPAPQYNEKGEPLVY